MKFCSKCKELKSLLDFHKKSSSKDGLFSFCKKCNNLRVLRWQKENTEKANKKANKWIDLNKDKSIKSRIKYKTNNPERIKDSNKKWNDNNPGKNAKSVKGWNKANPGKAAAYSAKRNAAKIKATPIWLTNEQLKEIEWFYITAKELQWLSNELLEVDHIEPLQGKNSCGLHVPWNLRIITRKQNRSKGNRI